MKQTHWFRECLGGVAACLMGLGRKKQGITSHELKDAEFKTSTQGMGMGMTDHIRDCFRFKWLRKY